MTKQAKSNLIFGTILVSLLVFLFLTPWGVSLRAWMSGVFLPSPDVENNLVTDNAEQFISTDWAVVNTSNDTLWLSEIDKPIFLNIWATWCGPCRAEMPSLLELEKKYKNKIEFLLVSPSENPATILNFKNTSEISSEFYTSGSYPPKNLQSNTFPTTYIISKDKVITHKFIGAYNWDDEEIEKVLDKISH